jgi:hypothetical protein
MIVQIILASRLGIRELEDSEVSLTPLLERY